MKKIAGLLWITLAVLWLHSCRPVVCENKAGLLCDEKTTVIIPPDSMKTMKMLLDWLDYHHCRLKENYAGFYLDFSENKIVQGPGRNAVLIPVEPPPCSNEEVEYDFNRILEVMLDGNNLLIEGVRMPPDSIGQYVYYQYLSYGQKDGFSQSPYGNGIWIITEINRPMNDLVPLIEKATEGYWQTMNLFADATLGKKLCALPEEDIALLRQRMPFRLSFKFSDEVKPMIRLSY